MAAQEYIIIILATIIGIAYLWKFRSYDIYEKEPFSKLLIVAVSGGFLSVFISLMLYEFVQVEETFKDSVFKIGPIEEFSKLLALFLIYRIYRNDFNEIVDGIIYITAVSLGFAIIENILYCLNSSVPFTLLIQRSIYSVLGHVSFSGYMGLAFYIHKKVHANSMGILVSVILASLAHGFYDGFIFQQEIAFLFRFVFIGLVLLQFWFLRTALGFSKHRLALSVYTFKPITSYLNQNCGGCMHQAQSKEHTFWKISASVCDNCGNMIFNHKNINLLFKYFRPVFRSNKFFKNLSAQKGIVLFEGTQHLHWDTFHKSLSAPVEELGKWLHDNNVNDRIKILKLPVIGFLFSAIGMKYLIHN